MSQYIILHVTITEYDTLKDKAQALSQIDILLEFTLL